MSFEKRQVPGQLHGSDQAGFLLFFLFPNGTSWREMSGQSPTDPRAADVVKLTECWWLFKAAGTVCFKLPG